MARMVWSEYFVAGIDSIDAQRRGLVELITAAPQLARVGEVPTRADGMS